MMAITSSKSSSVDLKRLALAVDQAVEFLHASQLPTGEFRTNLVPRTAVPIPPVPDSSPFPAALIAHCLSFVDTASTRQIVSKIAQFLLAQMQPGGFWCYFSTHHPRHNDSPLDLDDTACASAVLRDNNILVPDNADTLLANRNTQGLFYTWIVPHPRWLTSLQSLKVAWRQLKHPLRLRRFFQLNEAEPDDVDAVVNASALYWLGASQATMPVIEFLTQVIKDNKEESSDKWHHSRFNLYYFLSKSVYAKINSFSDVRDDIIHRIQCADSQSGLIGNNVLDTALALCALFNLSDDSALPDRTIDFLLAQQQSSGAWAALPLYYGGPSEGCSFSSEELTTAFCVEALARFQQQVGNG